MAPPLNLAAISVLLAAMPKGQLEGAHSSQIHPTSALPFLSEQLVSWRQLSHCWGANGGGNVVQ